MSGYAYDDQGNKILIRYASPSEQIDRQTGPIRPVSSEEMALIRQRRAEEEAELERQKARSRAAAKSKRDKECAENSDGSASTSPQKRALQLDDQPEDTANADATDQD